MDGSSKTTARTQRKARCKMPENDSIGATGDIFQRVDGQLERVVPALYSRIDDSEPFISLSIDSPLWGTRSLKGEISYRAWRKWADGAQLGDIIEMLDAKWRITALSLGNGSVIVNAIEAVHQ